MQLLLNIIRAASTLQSDCTAAENKHHHITTVGRDAVYVRKTFCCSDRTNARYTCDANTGGV